MVRPVAAEPAPLAVQPKPNLPAASERAPWLARALSWPVVSERPYSSAHLGRPHHAEIRVNPEARATYLDLVRDSDFADGTWLVESLRDARTGQTGPTLALERRAQSWHYWELEPTGRVRAQGVLPFCAGCHAGALAPPVFGLPRIETAAESNDAAARSPK